MHRTTTIALAAILAASITAGQAQAHLPQSARQLRAAHLADKPLPARTQLALAEQTIRTANGTLGFLRTHPTAGTPRVRRIMARNHRWLLRYGTAQQRAAEARLAAAALPAHYNGWNCIHSREGAWNSQTGNGYYGGLQMTYGWMGVVTNAALLSPVDQMWAAERVSARYGFSWSWMSGQWPRTYPPCSGFF